MIKITDAAAEQIRAVANNPDVYGMVLRVAAYQEDDGSVNYGMGFDQEREADEQLIVIHPSLDQAFVPEYYVAWIVFHEMLHDVYGVEQKRHRRVVHPPEFGVLEQSFPDFARAKDWEAHNLDRLLRFHR